MTIVVFVVVRKRWPSLPSKLIGLAAGTAVAALITGLIAGADVGPRVPFLGKIPAPDALLPAFTADGVSLALRFGYDLLVTALAIAVVGSLDSLLAAVGEADGPLDTAHHPNRLLIALGCGNLVSSMFGGVPVAYSSHHALTTHHGGGGKLVSSIATTTTLVLLLLYGAPLLQLIPVAALSAMMLVIAVGLIDRWAGSTIDRVRRGQYDSELIINIALVVLVAGVTIAFGLVAAVITGLILSMGLFLAVMNRSLIRSVTTGASRGSRRVYPPEQASLLRVEGHRIKIVELDGAIFFGTADRLAFEAMRAAEGAQFLIIDLRRVTMIDASGALMLYKLTRLSREQGVKLLLAHISATSKLGRALQSAGVFTQRHHADWFDDADRALEWAEHRLLEQAQVRGGRSRARDRRVRAAQGIVRGRAGIHETLSRPPAVSRARRALSRRAARRPDVPARARRGQHRGRGSGSEGQASPRRDARAGRDLRRIGDDRRRHALGDRDGRRRGRDVQPLAQQPRGDPRAQSGPLPAHLAQHGVPHVGIPAHDDQHTARRQRIGGLEPRKIREQPRVREGPQRDPDSTWMYGEGRARK